MSCLILYDFYPATSKSRGNLPSVKMSELVFNPFFQDISNMFKNQAFSAMYFGQHFRKNILILIHDLTLMIVFENIRQWSAPELTKAVSFRGERRKGIEVIGNDNVILLLDENGNLWRLVNAFEVSNGENESFHSLKEECFYEWIPFKKFNLMKVLAITAFEGGFACLGLCRNFKRKLLVLPTVDSALEEYTCDKLNVSESNSFCYYLTNLKIENSIFEKTLKSPSTDILLVTDKLSGKTYLCGKNGWCSLINVSNNFLISAVHFKQKKCLLLCFENGKLLFSFYNNGSQRESVAYLSEKIIFVDKCCCPDTCLLWSDGLNLNHTKLIFHNNEDVKLSHLKLNCCLQNPLSIVKINKQHILAVTINNFYYLISAGMDNASEIKKKPNELLSEICKGSNLTQELEEKTYLLSHYLHCKDIIQNDKISGKTEIKWEENSLVIKSHLGIPLREELWKLRLMSTNCHKNSVSVIDLEGDLGKEALIIIKNPFKSKCKIKASLIGDFNKKDLFLDLGEVEESEGNFEKHQLNKQIQMILRNRNKIHKKEVG